MKRIGIVGTGLIGKTCLQAIKNIEEAYKA